MRLTIDNILDRLDVAVALAMALQEQFGHEITGINHLEDIENFTPEQVLEHINNIYTNFPQKRILIFSGYVFTKYTFDTLCAFYNSELPDNNYVIIFWEYPLMIFFKNKEDYVDALKKMNEEQIKLSSLNVEDIVKSDNGIEIKYSTHSAIKMFEQRPIPMEKDFEI